MTWLAWRQNRSAAFFLLALATGVVGLIVWSGMQVLAQEKLTHFCEGSALSCGIGAGVFQSESSYHQLIAAYEPWVTYTAGFAPLVVGLWLGATLLPRELDLGTHVLAWAQSRDRGRWLIAQVGIRLLPGVAAIVAVTAATMWWLRVPRPTVWYPHPYVPWDHFSEEGLMPAATMAFSLTAGLLVGAVLRRPLQAVAVAIPSLLVAWLLAANVAFVVGLTILPTQTLAGSSPPTPPDAYVARYVDARGNTVQPATGPGGGPVWTPALVASIRATVYHPGSQYWALQAIDGAVLLGLSGVFLLMTRWWIRHRTV